ncbi:hypothetical protein AAC387_Pa08g2007 [Persea americana]
MSPICEPSVPTGYSHLERSDRTGFGIFRSPVPVLDPRRAIFEPKCRKRVSFRSKLPNRVSYFASRQFLQVTLISSDVAVPVSEFSGRRFPFRTTGGPFSSLSIGKASHFAPNSLTVSLICEQSVPTGYSHLE